MSKYTTGEIAKLCGVTVRTVQYYDTRGILIPAELSEGGRRLYSEDDLKRMKIICFLRDLGLPIDAISQMLSEKDPGSIISLLLEQQEQDLKKEIRESQEKLDKLETLRQELKSVKTISVESIGDIAYIMSNRKKLKKIHMNLLTIGIPVNVLQWVSIILWITKGFWWLFVTWAVIAVPHGIFISRYYFRNVAYLCPKCHTVFQPTLKEALFANHTPAARKLTCTSCSHHGFCMEVAREEAEIHE
ncbi:MAG: MerR family transcriptional regulator [Oscillospiraceae bacterium]|nr:MerR family transcriptional regulator [Oscillospiraceae bacterium]